MKIEFTLSEIDYVNFYLFAASKNKKAKTIKNWSRVGLITLLLYFGVNAYNKNIVWVSIVFVLLAILSLVFFDKVFNLQQNRLYSKIAKQNLSSRFGKEQIVEFTKDYVLSSDGTGENKTKFTEIEKISETANYFYVEISNNTFHILPKTSIANQKELKNLWNGLNIHVLEHVSNSSK